MASTAKVYWDLLRGVPVSDTGGTTNVPVPVLPYQALTPIRFEFVDVDPIEATTTAVDVSDVVTWRAAVANDWNPATEVMSRILDADIDDSDAVNGIVVVDVDCGSSEFLSAVTGQEYITAYMDVYGYNAGAEEIISIRALPVRARMSLDPASGDPLDPAALYYTKTEIDALLTNYATLAGDNAFTGANTFTSASGIVTIQSATQDAMRVIGRAGGTGSHVLSITPTTLTNSRTQTAQDLTGIITLQSAALTAGRLPGITTGGLLADTDISVGLADGIISRSGAVSVSTRLLVNTTTARTIATVPICQVEDTSNSAALSVTRNSADASSAFIVIAKSRSASLGGVTTVNTGDTLGQLIYAGTDGTSPVLAGMIQCNAEGTVSTGVVPGRLTLWTANASGALTERVRINSSGQVLIGTTTATSLISLKSGTTAADGIAFGTDTTLYRSAAGVLTTAGLTLTGALTGPAAMSVTAATSITLQSASKSWVFTGQAMSIADSAPSMSVEMTSTGNALTYFRAKNTNVTGYCLFGVGSTGYTTYSLLANRAFFLAGPTSDGIVFMAEGADPIIIATNGNNERFRWDSSGNPLIGATAAGTSATKTLGVGTGTAPGSSPADMFQMYSDDIVADNAAPHFRTEAGNVIKLYQQAEITDELTTVTFDAPGTPDYDLTSAVTDSSPFGLATADEFKTLLSVIANLQARVNELETVLVNTGLLADAD